MTLSQYLRNYRNRYLSGATSLGGRTHGLRRRTLITASLTGAAASPLLTALGGDGANAATVQTPAARPVAAGPSGLLDRIDLGDSASEESHAFSSPASAAVEGEHGQAARVAKPLDPAEVHLGELSFTVAVDPAVQNYLTLKISGSVSSAYKTAVYVDGQLAEYLMNGDFDPIDMAYGAGLPGRFVFLTALLPLNTTQGKTEAEITLRTYSSGLVADATADSRPFYAAYTHTAAAVIASEEDETGYTVTTQKAAGKTAAQERALVDSHRQKQLDLFDSLAEGADAGTPMPISRYNDNLRFYAEGIGAAWSPVTTEEDRRAALDRVLASIDLYTIEYYRDVTKLATGGHQSDWGGYYAALGEALYIVENLIADEAVMGRSAFEAFLAEPFDTGTEEGETSLASTGWDGGELTRFGAWERVLKATFDFARARQSYITNQVMYTYEGAWKAHEGLRVIGSEHYEGKERSHDIVRECLLGTKPWLGEEVLVGPEGEELDLSHTLFKHDKNVELTDDFVQVVMRGLAKSKTDDGRVVRVRPYGDAYTTLTGEGLARENGYVGNYGESQNYLPSWFFRTLGHEGDEALNEEILKTALLNIHSRRYTRYQGTDASGNRIMYMEQLVDSRNIQYPGRVAYGPDRSSGRAMLWASLEHYMVEHEADYEGEEWDRYWAYAAEAVGALQQQLIDNQYFNDFNAALNQHRYDLRFTATWEYVTGGRADFDRFGQVGAGVLLPHTDPDRYTDEELASLGVDRAAVPERYAFVDIDNLLVSARDGGTEFFAHLIYLNRGFAGNGRVHVMREGYDHTGQIATQGILSYKDYTIRADTTELAMLHDRYTPDKPDRALVGEILPIAYQPGLGALDRDNWQTDTPYSGYPDLIWARYGEYLIAVNTTREVYGNAADHAVAVPASGKVPDLVSGKDLRVRDGEITLAPHTAVMLKLESAEAEPDGPGQVDLVVATPGAGEIGLTWHRARGAQTYTVERSDRTGGWRTVADDHTGTSLVDADAPSRGTVRYRVRAVAGGDKGRWSTTVSVDAVAPSTPGLGGTWLAGPVGEAEGRVERAGKTFTFTGVVADGFAGGDDAVLQRRYGEDSLYAATRLIGGEGQVSARLEGAASGVTLRDATAGRARYVYFGANEDGKLELRTRSLDTRVDIGTSSPGVAGGEYGPTRSPVVEDIDDLSAAERPYVRLRREGHVITASAGADGQTWETVASVTVPMVAIVYAGVASAAASAVFRDVRVD